MKVISKVYASFAQSVLSLGGNVNTRVNNVASIRVYKFRRETHGFNMYAEYTQLQLTFLAL